MPQTTLKIFARFGMAVADNKSYTEALTDNVSIAESAL